MICFRYSSRACSYARFLVVVNIKIGRAAFTRASTVTIAKKHRSSPRDKKITKGVRPQKTIEVRVAASKSGPWSVALPASTSKFDEYASTSQKIE